MKILKDIIKYIKAVLKRWYDDDYHDIIEEYDRDNNLNHYN